MTYIRDRYGSEHRVEDARYDGERAASRGYGRYSNPYEEYRRSDYGSEERRAYRDWEDGYEAEARRQAYEAEEEHHREMIREQRALAQAREEEEAYYAAQQQYPEQEYPEPEPPEPEDIQGIPKNGSEVEEREGPDRVFNRTGTIVVSL
jgi:hypothetical protein